VGDVGGGAGEDDSAQERAPEEPDPFADLVLDDAFVRSAARSEPPASHRAPTRPLGPPPGQKRRQRRPGTARSLIRGHRGVVGSLLVIVVIIGGAALLGRGPLAPGSANRPAPGRSPAPSAPSASPSIGASKSTTTTIIQLAGGAYRPGDCVTWDQRSSNGHASTSVVPCARAHLIEIVSKGSPATLPKTYPSPAAWTQIFDSVCGPPSAKYLGYALFPHGRFDANGLYPTQAAWTQGDRTFWCGIGAKSNPFGPVGTTSLFLSFTGAVRGQSQELTIPVGTCFSAGTSQSFGPAVPCSQPHLAEVTGTATLSGVAQRPATSSAMESAVGGQCAALATQYAGGTLLSGTGSGWFDLSQADWDAGERTTSCTVGAYDASDSPIARTGSLRG
jgi:hypothetical protein